MRLNPYLMFNGDCEAASLQACRASDRRQDRPMLPYEGSPAAGHAPPEWQKKILHARIEIGEDAIMGLDASPGHYNKPQGAVTPRRHARGGRAYLQGPSPTAHDPDADGQDLLRQVRHAGRQVRHPLDGHLRKSAVSRSRALRVRPVPRLRGRECARVTCGRIRWVPGCDVRPVPARLARAFPTRGLRATPTRSSQRYARASCARRDAPRRPGATFPALPQRAPVHYAMLNDRHHAARDRRHRDGLHVRAGGAPSSGPAGRPRQSRQPAVQAGRAGRGAPTSRRRLRVDPVNARPPRARQPARRGFGDEAAARASRLAASRATLSRRSPHGDGLARACSCSSRRSARCTS